jgi:hypothetical protein
MFIFVNKIDFEILLTKIFLNICFQQFESTHCARKSLSYLNPQKSPLQVILAPLADEHEIGGVCFVF